MEQFLGPGNGCFWCKNVSYSFLEIAKMVNVEMVNFAKVHSHKVGAAVGSTLHGPARVLGVLSGDSCTVLYCTVC